MGSVLVRNITDAHVNQNRPDKNYSSTARLVLAATGAGAGRYGFMFWGKPFPIGANIGTAKLRLWNSETLDGSVTVTVERVTEKWSASRVTWNKRPAVGGTAYTLTKTGAASGSLWEIDITPMIQFVANGGAWYGVRITVDGTTARKFHSAQSDNSDRRPVVVIDWADNPDKPEDLNPRNNRAVSVSNPVLTTDFVDVSGDVQMSAMQVQISATNDFVTGGAYWDSGWVNTTVPQLDLATQGATIYPGLANGASTWWRARVRDGVGLESSWSDPVQFRRVDQGALTIVNPSAASPVISDVTPPISWTFANQTAYQILVVDRDLPNDPLWNSGKVTSPDQTVTVPRDRIKNVTDQLKVIVRAWDNVDRQKEGNRQAYVEAQRDFTFQRSATVATVTNLAATPAYPYPWVELTWQRGSFPDSYTVLMDNEVLDTDILPEDVFISGTSYKYIARRVPARVPHTFEVLAVQNGESSANNPTVNITTRPSVTWLMKPDTSSPICIVKSGSEPGPVVDATSASMQETHQPIGGGAPVLITQFMRGFEGHVEGVLSDDIVQGLSAREMRNRFKKFKREAGQKLLLFMVDETLEIIAFNMTYRPRAKSGGKILYDIAFDFFEAD